ncbi:DNA-processing protein DprA [Porphyromonas endodontalis]|uniref:DNA-processing protein DprA n=1 Tax=Porphyromonas endodontalis TaxID=28124 RepID=UPI00360BEA44
MGKAAYLLALSRIEGVGAITLRRILDAVDDVCDIFSNPVILEGVAPALYRRVVSHLSLSELLESAKREVEEAKRKHIDTFGLGDVDYPQLLAECADPPPAFFYFGNRDALHSPHCISVVGTRRASRYGLKAVEVLLEDLANKLPDLVVISGLAFGIDVKAHKVALDLGIPTIGVLAHGLDRIYPAAHRNIAIEMVKKGGLLSEYSWGSKVERHHFVGRNRIVAGLSHATLVVESADRGGSLLTSAMASGYGREVFAVPGRITDSTSVGCNRIIASMQAIPAVNADSIISVLGWGKSNGGEEESSSSLFVPQDLPDDPVLRLIVEEETIHFNDLLMRLGMSAAELSNKLFTLEFDGFIKPLPGGLYAKS